MRELTVPLLRALEAMPVVVVTGARQVGKTTLLRQQDALAKRRYVTLDDFAQLEAAARNPEALLCGAEGEMQTPPFLVEFFDTLRLPKRPAVEPVHPDEVLRGGLPPVALAPEADRTIWFRGYEQTYLERDLRDLSQVADLVVFRHFLVLAARRTGQVLNVSELARDAHLNHATASRYLGLLEASYVIRRVGPYLGNRSSRLIRSPKIFATDSGVAAHLAGVSSLGPASGEPLRGPLYETYAAANLAALLESGWPDASRRRWTTASGRCRWGCCFLEAESPHFRVEVYSGTPPSAFSRWRIHSACCSEATGWRDCA